MTDVPAKVIREANGEWRWVAGELTGKGGYFSAGIVAFGTEEEAASDMRIQSAAELDETGRRILPKEHLQSMIRALAAGCDDCEYTYFGGVYWHERDSSGCNWSVSTMSGDDPHGCFDCVRPGAAQLRASFSIAGEG